MSNPNVATTSTGAANALVIGALPFGDDSDFDDATRGLIAEGSGQIKAADGTVVWDIDLWGFLEGEAPTQPTRACGDRASWRP